MDLFINYLPKNIYKFLNSIWTDMHYGSPHIIGLLFSMVEETAYPSWKKWEEHYYLSGNQRIELLQRLSEDFKERALNPGRFSKKEISWPIYEVNYFHGRTKNEVFNIAKSLHNNSHRSFPDLDISFSETLEFVRFKIIGEPWNQLLIRYTRTVSELRNMVPQIQIKRAKIEFVKNYGFQGLITKNDKPRAGIQVKSAGWLKQFNLLRNQIRNSEEKVNAYKEEFGTEVFTFFSRLDGFIVNSEESKKFDLNSVKYLS